jgi:hypothetical protein
MGHSNAINHEEATFKRVAIISRLSNGGCCEEPFRHTCSNKQSDQNIRY